MSFWTDALGAEIKYYRAGPIRTRAIEAGSGAPLVLLHGLGGHAEAFIRNVVPLADAGFRVFAIDAIGHGFSDKPTDTLYHSPAFVEHLGRFLDSIGAQSAHLLGQSLGGWTALDFARNYPNRVRSLILVTSAGILIEQDDAARQKSEQVHKEVQQLNQRASSAPSREVVRQRLAWLMADPQTIIDELVDTRHKIYSRADSQAVMMKVSTEQPGPGNRSHMLREDDLKKIIAPTLFIWTDRNPSTPAAHAEIAARLMPNAQFKLIRGAGHWAQFERPDEINGLIIEFLRGLGQSPQS
jgi:pimeloyl-ACP methyl ester carboxylesterase